MITHLQHKQNVNFNLSQPIHTTNKHYAIHWSKQYHHRFCGGL